MFFQKRIHNIDFELIQNDLNKLNLTVSTSPVLISNIQSPLIESKEKFIVLMKLCNDWIKQFNCLKLQNQSTLANLDELTTCLDLIETKLANDGPVCDRLDHTIALDLDHCQNTVLLIKDQLDKLALSDPDQHEALKAQYEHVEIQKCR